MGLYRNIAGNGSEVGRTIPDMYFAKYDDSGGGGSGYFQEAAADPAPVNVVFYDPGYVAIDQHAYPDPEVVYEVRENAPITRIETVNPTPAGGVPLPGNEHEPAPAVITTVAVENEGGNPQLFPLLTLALLYANMVAGERYLGSNQGVVFIGGLGLLYYQLHKRAVTQAP